MAELTWNDAGTHVIETGVDHAVLYIGTQPGVPWVGLTSVNEVTTGGEITNYYIDGVKYLQQPDDQEFEAVIEAYTYPEEFYECEGVSEINGLHFTNQPKTSFSLAYRTKLYNDTDGLAHGYKLHLVYNAVAAPSEKTYTTINETPEAVAFSWTITTMPSDYLDFSPTAHVFIDSRTTPSEVLSDIEGIIFGTSTTTPRLPSVSEVIFMFESYSETDFNAGNVGDTYFAEIDSGHITTTQLDTIDGGIP